MNLPQKFEKLLYLRCISASTVSDVQSALDPIGYAIKHADRRCLLLIYESVWDIEKSEWIALSDWLHDNNRPIRDAVLEYFTWQYNKDCYDKPTWLK